MENFYEMNRPVTVPPSGKRKGRPSCNFSRSKAKQARYSGDDRIPRVSCTHTNSASCSAVTLTEKDLSFIKGQLYSTQNKIEQDAIILSHLDVMKCKRRRAKVQDEEKRRQRDLTIKYTVLKEDQTKVPVCQASFSSILCVGKDRVTHIAKYWHKKGRARPENRGGYREAKENTSKKTLPESSYQGPSNQSHPGKQGTPTTKNASTTVASEDSLSQHASWSQPTTSKFQKKAGSQLENQSFKNRVQKAMTRSVQPSHPAHTQMQVEQHIQVVAPPPASAQPAPRQVQVLAPPLQVSVAKQKLVENSRPQEKRIFVVADHQRCVMSNLASLWKSGKLCDAGIGNGSSTVMVHKLVLSAVCPKLLSVFNMDIKSHEFLQVNFPKEVSTEALNAFAEYMYNGILDLDHDILEQLKIIAKRLAMNDFEQLCDSHLSSHIHQPTSAVFTNVPLIKTTMQIPTMNSSLASFESALSTSMQSTPSITTQDIDIKQEIPKSSILNLPKSRQAPNKSVNVAGFVISPSIKTEPVGPEDDKYGLWSGSSHNQAFTSTNSSSPITAATTASTSIASVPVSSTEFAISSSEPTDIKSVRLKDPHSCGAFLTSDFSPVSNIVEMMHSQTSSMNEKSCQPLGQPSDSLQSVNLPKSNNAVYPIRLFTAKGDNLPLLTTDSSDAMAVNLFMPSEKT